MKKSLCRTQTTCWSKSKLQLATCVGSVVFMVTVFGYLLSKQCIAVLNDQTSERWILAQYGPIIDTPGQELLFRCSPSRASWPSLRWQSPWMGTFQVGWAASNGFTNLKSDLPTEQNAWLLMCWCFCNDWFLLMCLWEPEQAVWLNLLILLRF